MRNANLPLARYSDRGGRAHLVVLRGRLVLDVAISEPPRVVAELGEGEGARQARALLADDGGYLERARRAERPLCRPLRIEDLRPPAQTVDPSEPSRTDAAEAVRESGEPPTLAA
jgi:hypothetical protein